MRGGKRVAPPGAVGGAIVVTGTGATVGGCVGTKGQTGV